jgi:hypothetical protein
MCEKLERNYLFAGLDFDFNTHQESRRDDIIVEININKENKKPEGGDKCCFSVLKDMRF